MHDTALAVKVRMVGIALLFAALPVACKLAPTQTLSECPNKCSGHGVCYYWPTEPSFPPFCMCGQYYEGRTCEIRQPNPWYEHNPLSGKSELTKHDDWLKTAGVACGGERFAKSCADCIPQVTPVDESHGPDIEKLCAGECYWSAPNVCTRIPKYNPFRIEDERLRTGSHALRHAAANGKNTGRARAFARRPAARGKAEGKAAARGRGRPRAPTIVRTAAEAAVAARSRLSGLRDPLRRGNGRGGGNGRGRGVAAVHAATSESNG